MDRHVIANMGAELGATSTVFPSDEEIRRFLKAQGREEDWIELVADEGATYDLHEEINLSELEPLIAKPSSPGNVVPVTEVAGRADLSSVHRLFRQSRVPRFRSRRRDRQRKKVAPGVSLDINPTSRQMLTDLVREGYIGHLAASRSASAPSRLQRLHRHGAGSGDRSQQPAHDSAQFPGSFRH